MTLTFIVNEPPFTIDQIPLKGIVMIMLMILFFIVFTLVTIYRMIDKEWSVDRLPSESL